MDNATDPPRKGDDIAERLLDLAAFVLKVGPQLARAGVPSKIITQLQSAGTSPGANYEEARGAQSRKDFVHKLRIALKEVRETRYWLRLLVRAGLLEQSEAVSHAIEEARQLTAILTASSQTAATNLEASRRTRAKLKD